MPTSSTTSAVVTVANLMLETARRVLLEDVSFAVQSGRRLALVGRNGSGKTSLLTAIAARGGGAHAPAHARVGRGRIVMAPGTTCSLVAQHPDQGDATKRADDFIDARAGAAAAVHRRYTALTADPAVLSTNEGLREYGELAHLMDALGAWGHAERRDAVVRGLGLDPGELDRPLTGFSGGETMRLALAGTLLSNADLLLLDEPTNNLDEVAVTFLCNWLRESTAAVLLVSHDRAFLDALVDEVLEIGEHDATVALYGGSYPFYVQRKRIEFDAAMRQHEEQVMRRDALLVSAEALASSAQRFQSASQNDFYRARGRKVARRATVQLARVERELGSLAEPQRPRRPRIEVAGTPGDGGRILAADGITLLAGDKVLLTSFSMTLARGERMAIVGPNGSGKTSLVRALLGEIEVGAGRVLRDASARVAYLPQSVVPPAPNETVIDRARRTASISEEDARCLLGKVVFTDVGDLPLAGFSAGERRRIELAVLFAAAPDLVVLDEPTNHLDLPTIEMLEEALNVFGGALLTVSHDARYLENIRSHRTLRLLGELSS